MTAIRCVVRAIYWLERANANVTANNNMQIVDYEFSYFFLFFLTDEPFSLPGLSVKHDRDREDYGHDYEVDNNGKKPMMTAHSVPLFFK